MKKTVLTFATVVLILTAVAISTIIGAVAVDTPKATTSSIIIGDANGDGIVNNLDATQILKYDAALPAHEMVGKEVSTVTISDTYVDDNLHFWVEFSDGTKTDMGYVGVPADDSESVPEPELPVTYTVAFKDWDGTVLKTETVESGKAATAPAAPFRNGYLFAGWDKVFNNITGNLTVTATYTQITDPTIVIGNVTGNVGDEVVVTFDLVNSPELYAMSLKLDFNEIALTLVSAESGEAMDDFTYTAPSRLKRGSNFMWYANDPATGNGTVLRLTFKINQGATAGTYPITMTCDSGNTYDANDNDVDLGFVYGSVVVNG